jgi:tetratricopeptide (TPR) repeat protein
MIPNRYTVRDNRLLRIAFRLWLACAFLVSFLFALADLLHHQASQRSLEWAQWLAPWDARHPLVLADLDPAGPLRHLGRAHALRPGYTPVALRLALEAEAKGDPAAAEHQLQEALRRDPTFLPHWTLTNFYFRRSDWEPFWRHARQAVSIYEGDLTGVFRLCLRIEPDPFQLLARLQPARPSAKLDLFRVLLACGDRSGAAKLANLIARDRLPDAKELLLEACHQAVLAREPASLSFWNALTGSHLSDGEPLAPEAGKSLNNGRFARSPSGACFDWKLHRADGLRARAGGSGGFRADLSGGQPEALTILEQWLPLDPQARYRLIWISRERFQTDAAGFEWRLDGQPLAPLRDGRAEFSASGRQFAQLTLATRRHPGTTRPSGELQIQEVFLKRL